MQTIFLTILLTVSQTPKTSSPQPLSARAQGAALALIEEADVPAPTEGILMTIPVREGVSVQKGAEMAQIDDREAVGRTKIAEFELAAAAEEAKNDAEIREAEAITRVMKANLEQAKATRERAPQSVTETEMRSLELNVERYILQKEVAVKKRTIAEITRKNKAAAVDLSSLLVTKLKIASPLDGIVVQVYKNVGEWVKPGDPIARVVRMDRLRVEGDFSADLYSPEDLIGRPVTVEVRLPRDRVVQLQGEVTFVSPLVDLANDFQVWAEVQNREENGFWLLRPGLAAEMTIQLK